MPDIEYCNCHPTGSLQSSCDPVTSSCYCRPAVGGSSCSHCENEYWGFSRILTHNNTGCTRTYRSKERRTPISDKVRYDSPTIACGCHPYGSTRKDCLQDTGECSCQPFATGRQCDRCTNASLSLTDRGCVNCTSCLTGAYLFLLTNFFLSSAQEPSTSANLPRFTLPVRRRMPNRQWPSSLYVLSRDMYRGRATHHEYMRLGWTNLQIEMLH